MSPFTLGSAAFLLIAVSAFAQQAPPVSTPDLPTRESVAQKRSEEWEALAKGLESKIARMLPCDARVRGAIEEVSRASQARMTSLRDYLQSAAAQATSDAERAQASATEMQRAAREAGVERTEAEQQRAAVDGEIADLKESARQRPSLDEAAAKLADIQSITVARVERWQKEAAEKVALGAALSDLASAYGARQKAIEAELAALAEETARWTDYYAARLSRAQVECSIAEQVRAPKRRGQ